MLNSWHHMGWIRFLFLVALVTRAGWVSAAPYDKSANSKIDEAINTHYLATEFDKAEGMLKGVLAACADKCSPEVLARTWMYIGIVRGSGKQDVTGTREAFVQAVTLDPEVKLDSGLASKEVKAIFTEIAGTSADAAPAEASEPSSETESGTPAGGMECTPSVREIQTRRAIPISCTTAEPAVRAEIRYKEFGASQWKTVQMGTSAGRWLGTIPCSATDLQGSLLWYVNAKDESGELIDNFATQREPVEMQVLETTTAEPPAYPGQTAPARCGSSSECPEEMLGTPACPGTVKRSARSGNRAWGEPCEETNQCSSGLVCNNGACETPPSCESDADCGEGRCVNLVCESIDDEPSDGASRLNWVGLHFAADLGLVSGTDVCRDDAYACFYGDGVKVGSLGERFGEGDDAGTINSGFAERNTMRVLATYERLLSPKLGLEGRFGFAFNSAPTSGDVTFLPLHAEARVKYWFLGGPGKTGFKPYAALGGGLAQVDAMVTVEIKQDVSQCTRPDASDCPASQLNVEGYKRMGTSFVGAALGGAWFFTEGVGANLNLNGMFMFPNSGLVIEPSLGAILGF